MRKKVISVIMVLVMILSLCGFKNDDSVADKNEKYNQSYTVDNFPFYYSDHKKVIKFYDRVIDGKEKNSYNVTYDNNEVKQSLEETEYIYYGKMKDGRADGLGAVFISTNSKKYVVFEVGNYKKGKLDGYGIAFAPYIDNTEETVDNDVKELYLYYEGKYKKGTRAEGVTYGWDTMEEEPYTEEIVTNGDYSFITNAPVKVNYIVYIGEFKYDSYNGEGTLYYTNGLPEYAGTFKYGDKKKGSLYDENGNKIYEGGFLNGKYEGKGILYNEDGSVKYKGKFENGDVK